MAKERTPADRSSFKNSSWDQNKTVGALEEIFVLVQNQGLNPGIQSRDPGIGISQSRNPGIGK